jgi:DNA-binding transcriptional LysR family regulator
MKNYRLGLPPLDTLIFFEAAYRTRSFTASAAELSVSQVAVSKRVRQLEEWVGDALFVRDGKKLFPTASGDKLFQTAAMTLEFLQHGLGALREEAQRPLSIGANAAVGMFWLTPQLRAFGFSPHACPTRLLTSDNPQDLMNGSNDLVVSYGDGSIPGRTATLLLEEVLAPVAAPRVAEEFAGLKSIKDMPRNRRTKILNYGRAAPDWVDWRVWFQALSLGTLEGWPVEAHSTYSKTIGEAIKGNGIALGSITLLSPELASGSLAVVGTDALRTGRGYYISHSDRAVLSDDARNLVTYLVSAARSEDAANASAIGKAIG